MTRLVVQAIGNAAVDIIAPVSEDFLKEHQLTKSACVAIDGQTSDTFLKILDFDAIVPGGAAANVCATIGALGGAAEFIGKAGDDNEGKLLRDSLKQYGVIFDTPPSAKESTAKIYTLITPDRDRTFASYYGASNDLSLQDIEDVGKRPSAFLYLDGYALAHPHGFEVLREAAIKAKKKGTTILFSPNDINLIEECSVEMKELYALADIVFLNSMEAVKLSGEKNMRDTVHKFLKTDKTLLITRSERGSYILHQGGMNEVEAAPLRRPIVNTNGAGDHYVGGFLFGLAQGFSIQDAARLGAWCAREVLTVEGARPQQSYAPLLEDFKRNPFQYCLKVK
jgi:sugar/nucleoside kinase (ribokinase family)